MSKIEVVPYNPEWPDIFLRESQKIEKALEVNFIEIHHVGSTSVKNLCAKPKIDVIIVVEDLDLAIKQLESIGYKYKGNVNIPFHLYFSKAEIGYGVNLHVYNPGNSEIELNIKFRDYLRNNISAKEEYAALKMHLISQEELHKKNNNSIFSGYNLGKNEFIQKSLREANFNSLALRYCSHYLEWENYHRIVKEASLDSIGIDNPNYFHFVLYKGTVIIGVACVELVENSNAKVHYTLADKSSLDYLNNLINKWVDEKAKIH